MRARNIKPGFFINEDLADVSFQARLLFIGLWLCADREGLVEYRPKRLKIQIFPYDNINIEKLLGELRASTVIVYWCEALPNGNGNEEDPVVIEILGFAKHQNPHRKEKASELVHLKKSLVITGQAPCKYGSRPAERGKRKEERGKRNTAVEKLTATADRLIHYLNEKTGKSFRLSETSRKPILLILGKGATLEECKKVIDNKISDPDFDRKYLQPSTLFRPANFENYLNHNPAILSGQSHTCESCFKFCVPGSPDKCQKSGSRSACAEYEIYPKGLACQIVTKRGQI